MPSTATITTSQITTFSPNTLIKSSEWNTTFGVIRGHIIPIDPSTSTASDMIYSLGSTSYRWRNVYAGDLYLYGSTITASSTFSILPSLSTSARVQFLVDATATKYSFIMGGQERQIFEYDGIQHLISSTITSALSASYRKIGFKTDGKPYYRDNSSEFQIICNGDFSITTANATAFANWSIGAIGAYGDVTNITVAKGTWSFSLALEMENNGVVTTNAVIMGLGTEAGNTAAGLTNAGNRGILVPVPTANGGEYILSINNYEATVDTTTTFYFKGRATSSITNLRYRYWYAARRIADGSNR